MTRLFRKQLIVAVLPVLILAALSTVWTTRVSEQHMIAQLETELSVESDLHAANIRSLLEERLAELRAIAATPSVRSGDFQLILPYLTAENKRLSDHFEGLYLNDLDGNVRGTRGEQFSVAKRDYFPRLKKGETIVTDEIISLATEQRIVLIVVPVYDDAGMHRGAIGGSILVSTIRARIEAVVQPSQGFAALVDSRGELLTPKASSIVPVSKAFDEWLKNGHRELDSTQTSSDVHPIHTASLLGEQYLIVHREVPRTGWQLYLAKRAAIATKPATDVRWANLLFSGLVLVIAFLVAYYFTGRLLVPLAELLEVHRRFGQGDYQARITDLPDDELGELGHAFNRTAAQLAERQAAQKAAERSLRESEARLRLLSDNVDDAIILHDLDGQIRDVNHATCEGLGYTFDELLRSNITELIAQPDATEIRHVWRTIAQRQEKVRRLEVTYRRKDGTAFPVEMSAVPLQTAQGVRILVSARDISERRRADDQMANFFRLSEDMMCIADEDGIFRQLSPAFEQVLGYKLDELLGRPYVEFVHPDDQERTRQEGRKIYEGRGNVNFENRYRCKDGTYKWLQWRPFREVYEGMIYAIARDVTDSHRTTRLMQQTSSAAKIGGWEYDLITNQLYWTEETYRLHDLSPDSYEPTGDAMNFYTADSRAKFLAAVQQALQDGRPYNLELEMVTVLGRRIWVHVLAQVDMENGTAVRTYGSFQDITERKAAENERRKLDDQLREIQRIESIGILAGGIAHDFNNLLTGVLGFTRLAAAEAEANGSDSMRSHLQQIEQCSLRAADLCKQLLAYAGKGHFVLETIDISELVREISTLVESIVGSHAKLDVQFADALPLIEGDATQLRQVVMNLVTNAFDALGQEEGTVHVETGLRDFTDEMLKSVGSHGDLSPGRHVFVEVTDTGIGMSEETLARIFDPFFTTKFAGRGLGLAAVQGIIRSHHGAILVRSKLGQGTTFTIVLPAAEDPEEARAANRAERTPAEVSPRAISGGTILLIDDEAAVLSLAETALQKGGFHVLKALDGASGLSLYEQHASEIAAVIVDITMPGMNGLEVLRKLRSFDEHLPLLPMSGYTEKSLDAATEELKLSSFVEKPFRLGDVVTAVQKALQAKR